MALTEKEEVARKRVCLALDVSSVQEALTLANELSEYVGMFKIGGELHCAANNEAVPIIGRIYATNHDVSGNVFLDLKFHDTPNTVYKDAMNSAIPGVRVFNLHIAGGENMCRKALEGAYEGAQKNRIEKPKVIGVTELTSIDNSDLEKQGIGISYKDLVERRTELAREWGLDGVVCPAKEAGNLEKKFGSDFLYVTPGIQYAGVFRQGQKQLYTPAQAVQDCKSSVLVIGGAVTLAGNEYDPEDKTKIVKAGTRDDRRRIAYEILQSMATYL